MKKNTNHFIKQNTNLFLQSKKIVSLPARTVKLRYATEILLTLVVILYGATSCSLFSSEKITDYLNKQTCEVKVVQLQEPDNYILDGESVISVPSDKDCTLSYIIKNPQGLKISATVTNKADEGGLLSSLVAPYTAAASEDNNYVTVTLTKDMLRIMEKGGDVSPVISLSAAGYSEAIESYSTAVRSNSVPLRLEGACVMIDTSEAVYSGSISSKGQYVLCFNLPERIFDANDIQCDASKVYVTGLNTTLTIYLKYEKGVSLNIDTAAHTWNTTDLPNAHSTGYAKNPYMNNNAVEFIAGSFPVYILTGVQATDNDSRDFAITLEDAKGLRTSVTVNTQYSKLKPVTANCTSETVNEDGQYVIPLVDSEGNPAAYYSIVLTSPTKTSKLLENVDGVSISCRVYRYDGASSYVLVASGSAENSYSYNVADGVYYVVAYAYKDGYIDSTMATWELLVGNYL